VVELSGVDESGDGVSGGDVRVGVGELSGGGSGVADGICVGATGVSDGLRDSGCSTGKVTPRASTVKAIAVAMYSVGITVGSFVLVGKVHPTTKIPRKNTSSLRRNIIIIKYRYQDTCKRKICFLPMLFVAGEGF